MRGCTRRLGGFGKFLGRLAGRTRRFSSAVLHRAILLSYFLRTGGSGACDGSTAIGSKLDPAIETCGKATKLVNAAHNGGGREGGRTCPRHEGSAARAGEARHERPAHGVRLWVTGAVNMHILSSKTHTFKRMLRRRRVQATLNCPRRGTEEC